MYEKLVQHLWSDFMYEKLAEYLSRNKKFKFGRNAPLFGDKWLFGFRKTTPYFAKGWIFHVGKFYIGRF